MITGGTGLVGSALVAELLQKGYDIILLTRQRETEALSFAQHPSVRYAHWDPRKGELDLNALSQADHIVHLAGANVAERRWTATRKKEIADSRVQSGRLLVDTLKKLSHRPLSLVSASAIGWYGADTKDPPTPFTENDRPDTSFLGETCRQWEESTAAVVHQGIRRVILRIGIVLSRKGGALPEFERPLRFGIAPVLGSGKQIISWIQLDDLVSMILFSIEQSLPEGIYNAAAPAPVSQQELMIALARQRKKFYLPLRVPSFVLKLMMGEMSIEVLKSTTVSSAKIQEAGFQFRYPSLEDALAVC